MPQFTALGCREFEAGVAAEQGHANKEQVQRVRDLFYRQLKVGLRLAVSLLPLWSSSLPHGSQMLMTTLYACCTLKECWCLQLIIR